MSLDAPRMRLIALLVAIAATVVVVVLLIGGGEESQEEAAEAAAEEFVTAVEEGDFESACGLLTEELRQDFGAAQCPEQLASTSGTISEGFEIEIAEVRVSGPKAAADTEIRLPGQGPPQERSFDLQQEQGSWRVSSPLQ